MASPSVKVEGAKELRRALKQFEDGASDLKGAHLEAARVVERRAGELVPRRSGALAGSGRSSGQASGGVVRFGRAAVPYAPYVIFGVPSRNMAPQPFIYDALDDRRSQVVEVYEAAVDKLINKYDLG